MKLFIKFEHPIPCLLSASMSGPPEIAKVFGQGKGYAKSPESEDRTKKNHYLFEQRSELNKLETSVRVNGGQPNSS